MKTLKTALLVSILLISQFIYADQPKDQVDIEQVITTYVKSVDSQDAAQLSSTLLPTASFVIYNEKNNKMDGYSTNQLITLVKGGQKGGWQRNVTISSVTFEGNTAMAKFEITDSRIKESGFLTLVKDNGSWKISSNVSNLHIIK